VTILDDDFPETPKPQNPKTPEKIIIKLFKQDYISLLSIFVIANISDTLADWLVSITIKDRFWHDSSLYLILLFYP